MTFHFLLLIKAVRSLVRDSLKGTAYSKKFDRQRTLVFFGRCQATLALKNYFAAICFCCFLTPNTSAWWTVLIVSDINVLVMGVDKLKVELATRVFE